MIWPRFIRCAVFTVILSSAVFDAPTAEARTKRRVVIKRKVAPRKAAPRKAPKKVAPRVVPRPSTTISGDDYREQSRQRAVELVKQAASAFERGDYNSTVALCKIANDAYPTYSRAYTWMGAGYQKLGNKIEACSAFKWVIALSPNTPDAERAERGLREMGYYNPSF